MTLIGTIQDAVAYAREDMSELLPSEDLSIIKRHNALQSSDGVMMSSNCRTIMTSSLPPPPKKNAFNEIHNNIVIQKSHKNCILLLTCFLN